MNEAYKLNFCDILSVFKEQLATHEFNRNIDYVPYLEFNGEGNPVYSNLMSGLWAHCQAVQKFYAKLYKPLIVYLGQNFEG